MVILYPVKAKMKKADKRYKAGYRIEVRDLYCEYKDNDTSGIPCIRYRCSGYESIVEIC